MKYKFSLIMATYGRDEEIALFLESINRSEYDLGKIQIIIVDQNDSEEINLEKIVLQYKNMDILHIKSNKKGLSHNRNLGLQYAEGEYIAFPDDDCEYYIDTLNEVELTFKNHVNSNLVLGRIIDKAENDVIRKWPKSSMKINEKNFFTKVSSITMFYKNTLDLYKFNEKLGVGTYFGSCEDTDIVYRYTKNSHVEYNPNIKVYHPHPSKELSMDKVKSYALGFGGFIKSNLDFYTAILFIKVICYHFLKLIGAIVTFNREKLRRSWNSVYFRIKGFLEYKKIERE
ncbi:glycosyltransferase family 2 protein [Bacillus cereus group sp. N6]|uniref:glycosyltransferase family 2 protein n=1 Tax=Bacillus cereus group sp. N6 TaxID=2794583 RepID=UPI0018F4CC72|nr:glycosyltransferase family 2 protein [Bacillus cereus group sp. N6]MBJ8111775.1 glycosyltransferase family 2 protein [Bacillus cereus group sp. N6]